MIRTKPILTVIVCVLLMAAAAWSLRRQLASGPSFNVDLHRAVGRAMAEQTARLVNNSGRIVLVYIDPAGRPELQTQLAEFEQALQRFPNVSIKERYPIETEGQAKYSYGTGLSGRRYVRIVNKNQSADAMVSFVGAPRLSAEERAEMKKVPRFLAESRSPDKLRAPFAQGILDVAVVTRFQFPAPVTGTPRTLEEWFAQRWQVVTTNDAAALPDGDEE